MDVSTIIATSVGIVVFYVGVLGLWAWEQHGELIEDLGKYYTRKYKRNILMEGPGTTEKNNQKWPNWIDRIDKLCQQLKLACAGEMKVGKLPGTPMTWPRKRRIPNG